LKKFNEKKQELIDKKNELNNSISDWKNEITTLEAKYDIVLKNQQKSEILKKEKETMSNSLVIDYELLFKSSKKLLENVRKMSNSGMIGFYLSDYIHEMPKIHFEMSNGLNVNYAEMKNIKEKISKEINTFQHQVQVSVKYNQEYYENRIREKSILLKQVEMKKKRQYFLELQLKYIAKLLQKKDEYYQIIEDSKTIQKQIRLFALAQLHQKITDYYHFLSDQDEFAEIKVSNEDYSLMVMPKSQDNFISAYTYEGGGQKLLLSLAYKLALGSLFHNLSFILADEPTYGADEINRKKLLNKIRAFPYCEQLFLITHQNAELFDKKDIISIEKIANISKVVI